MENRRFEPTPLLFGASFGVISLEFRRDFCLHKTRVPGLLYGVACVILVLAVFVELPRALTFDSGPYRVVTLLYHDLTANFQTVLFPLLHHPLGIASLHTFATPPHTPFS